ncbi:MAG TPA: hypothetical protein PLD47_05855 [Aggregatilineales bacterium]|nr:hypothetical protein [Anaerolineales bacterium]HRE47232.1 hypothetical protein [Aggregatilineales bacterium]
MRIPRPDPHDYHDYDDEDADPVTDYLAEATRRETLAEAIHEARESLAAAIQQLETTMFDLRAIQRGFACADVKIAQAEVQIKAFNGGVESYNHLIKVLRWQRDSALRSRDALWYMVTRKGRG